MHRWCGVPWLVLAGSLAVSAPALAAPRAVAAPRELTLGFVGDLMMHGVNRGMADYGELYRGLGGLLRDDDLTFANLEFPIDPGRAYRDFPLFNGTPAYLRAAVDAGIDAFSLANNHAFDGAEEGVVQTLRALDAAERAAGRPLARAGTRANPEIPFGAARLEAAGVRISFLAATQFLNARRGRERVMVVDYRDARAADGFAALVAAESAACDVLVVSYHGGIEYADAPEPGLDEFLGRLAACGATVVYGHHPHVLQAPRFVFSGLCRRIVLPSMGNFVSGQAANLDPETGLGAEAPGTGDGALVRVRLLCRPGWATVIGVEAVPLAVHRDGRGELVVGRLAALAGSGPDPSAREAYYRGRLEAITGLLAGVVTSCGRAASPRK